DAARYDESGDADWLSGACLLVRRRLLEELDGFDEGFFMYCEDTDLCRRTWDVGRSVRFVAEAKAEHEGGQSAPRSSLLPVLARSRRSVRRPAPRPDCGRRRAVRRRARGAHACRCRSRRALDALGPPRG